MHYWLYFYHSLKHVPSHTTVTRVYYRYNNKEAYLLLCLHIHTCEIHPVEPLNFGNLLEKQRPLGTHKHSLTVPNAMESPFPSVKARSQEQNSEDGKVSRKRGQTEAMLSKNQSYWKAEPYICHDSTGVKFTTKTTTCHRIALQKSQLQFKKENPSHYPHVCEENIENQLSKNTQTVLRLCERSCYRFSRLLRIQRGIPEFKSSLLLNRWGLE